MMKLSKKLLIVMLITMMLGATIITCSNAATATSNTVNIPKDVQDQINENLKSLDRILDEAMQKNELLRAGQNMKLNRAPGFSFDENGSKIDVKISDGTGIYTINGTDLDTKKALMNEIKIDKKGTTEKLLKFNEPAKGKTKLWEFIAKDHSKYSSKVQVKIKNDNGEDTFNVSMRVNFSMDKDHKYLNILLRDNAGVNATNAAIEVYDRNQKDKDGNVKKVAEAKGSKISIAKNPAIYRGKIVYGIYQLDMKKLKKNANGKYVVTVKTTDNSGLKGYRTAEFYY